jgi:hypothetical protein
MPGTQVSAARHKESNRMRTGAHSALGGRMIRLLAVVVLASVVVAMLSPVR